MARFPSPPARPAAFRCGRLVGALACLLAAGLALAEDQLKPGQFRWRPELAPQGPVVVVVSLPEQQAHVYRNGVRIGVSTVSTGRPGYETPTGVFTILEKRREHYSNLYDNAPMPWMQRLTWDGIAMHAGKLPGYPASHGCVRLPAAFARSLFETTARGMTVVIADAASFPPAVVSPGWLAPIAERGTVLAPAAGAAPVATEGWHPERAPAGTVAVVISLRDRTLAVLRGGVEIGRTPVEWTGPTTPVTQAWVLLDGGGAPTAAGVAARPARRWLRLDTKGEAPGEDVLGAAIRDGALVVPPAFAAQVDALLLPGATVVVTDEPLQSPAVPDASPLLESEATATGRPAPAPAPAPATAPAPAATP